MTKQLQILLILSASDDNLRRDFAILQNPEIMGLRKEHTLNKFMWQQ